MDTNITRLRDSSRVSLQEIHTAQDNQKLMEVLGFNPTDIPALEKAIFTCINQDNRSLLMQIFEKYPSDTTILQVLLTTSYPNRDGFYRHDNEVLNEAAELLGSRFLCLIFEFLISYYSLENLNALQIACLLGEEDLAMDILDFVARITDEIHSKKVLYEFMGRVWGDGNTTLHLAAFMGMVDLVTVMIQLGAAKSKSNNRKYKPVDCADDELTREAFEKNEEGLYMETTF